MNKTDKTPRLQGPYPFVWKKENKKWEKIKEKRVKYIALDTERELMQGRREGARMGF